MSGALAPLVVIVGPTASGKSALGIWLAERLGGEILVCDSTQVYRRFNIGTGKVPPAAQRGIRHHLVDLVEPGEVFTAGDYRRRALEVLDDVRARGRLPIITAGTGLYLRALLEGLADAPRRSEELRKRLREKASRRGTPYLHRLLVRVDAAAAGRIAERDSQKVIRALEIRLLAGKPVDEVHRGGRQVLEGFSAIKVGLMPPRSELYERIDKRVGEMLRAGWLNEVEGLIFRGSREASKHFEFIGYGEVLAILQGKVSAEEGIPRIQKATRQYAKRQLTWFRRESGVRWLEGFGDSQHVQEAVVEYVESELGSR